MFVKHYRCLITRLFKTEQRTVVWLWRVDATTSEIYFSSQTNYQKAKAST